MEAAIQHYQNKLAFEMDPSDLFDALEAKENIVVIDARKDFAYIKEHIPGALCLREIIALSWQLCCRCDNRGFRRIGSLATARNPHDILSRNDWSF